MNLQRQRRDAVVHLQPRGGCMESVVVLAIIATICYYAYRSGKRIGSRKGFHAGRRRGRRR
jgi:hypothetical protein